MLQSGIHLSLLPAATTDGTDSMSTDPRLSIIIPTYNRSQYVIRTVAQVLEQSFQDFELWVVDQSDVEQAEANRIALAAMSDDRVNYLRCDARGVANARNEGLVRASHEIIVFLDDDVILLNDDFLSSHLDAYQNPLIGGVTGRTVERTNRENARPTTNRITVGGRTLINLLGTEPCRIHSLKGANMSVRATAIAGMGGFDRNYTGTALLEEADFSERIMRRGWQLWFEPKAELFHLSAPAGGVRVSTDDQTLYYRFRSTAYFVRKHRGRVGLVSFYLTHALVAAKYAAARRSIALPARLVVGSLDGIALFRRGTNETLNRQSELNHAAF